MNLEVKGFLETSFLDWDGKIVAVIYVGTCNFRCPFCHNFGLVTNPSQYDNVPLEKIKKYLIDHKNFIDGICLTGGEPGLHKDKGLMDFINDIKGMGLLVKLDTNGTDPELIQELINKKMVDYIAMDIKAPLNEKYNQLSGVKASLAQIKKSIKIIINSNILHEFRTTVIPTKLSEKDILDITIDLKGAKKYVLQQFIPDHCWDEEYKKIKPYNKEELLNMEKLAQANIQNTIIRGV